MSETSFLTGVSNVYVKAVAFEHSIGLLIQPGNRYERQVAEFPFWAGDNAAFKLGASHEDFDFDKYEDFLRVRLAGLTAEEKATCLFVNAPDAIDVTNPKVTQAPPVVTGHPELTIKWGLEWLPVIRELGLPTGFVAGDGHEAMLDELPWDLMDVLFLGGSDEWKLGEGARIVTEEARRRGLKVHMGRVNSRKRFHYAASVGCSTADGTFLKFANGQAGVDRLLRWCPGTPELPPVPAAAPAPMAPAATAAVVIDLSETGVVCGRCSTRGSKLRHASPAAVRACHELGLERVAA